MPKIVLANGVFDLFHIGHVRYLQAARRFGDTLIVGVTSDKFVNKGPDRPFYSEDDRLLVVGSLSCVDMAFICDGGGEALKRAKPNFFVKGREYEGNIEAEHESYCRARGIEIAFTGTQKFSSTDLLHHYDRLRKS